MMESVFLDQKELAALLHVGTRSARRLCADYGVLPIPRRGRTSRLLWSRQDVMQVVDILRTQARAAPQDFVKPSKGDLRVAGKTARQIFAMVTQ